MATKGKKAAEPVQRKPDVLQVDSRYFREGEAAKMKGATSAEFAAFSDKITARALHQPEVRAARVIQRFEGESLDINAAADELRELVAEVQAGSMKRPEAMLVAQAHTLDALFSLLATRSHANSNAGYLDAADKYLRLALKAQAQSVRTIEALGELKNPKPVTFVRQANVANGPQQINNGVSGQVRAGAHAHGNIPIQPNELSGGGNELLPDARASGFTIPANQEVEALGEIHRAEVRRG